MKFSLEIAPPFVWRTFFCCCGSGGAGRDCGCGLGERPGDAGLGARPGDIGRLGTTPPPPFCSPSPSSASPGSSALSALKSSKSPSSASPSISPTSPTSSLTLRPFFNRRNLSRFSSLSFISGHSYVKSTRLLQLQIPVPPPSLRSTTTSANLASNTSSNVSSYTPYSFVLGVNGAGGVVIWTCVSLSTLTSEGGRDLPPTDTVTPASKPRPRTTQMVPPALVPEGGTTASTTTAPAAASPPRAHSISAVSIVGSARMRGARGAVVAKLWNSFRMRRMSHLSSSHTCRSESTDSVRSSLRAVKMDASRNMHSSEVGRRV